VVLLLRAFPATAPMPETRVGNASAATVQETAADSRQSEQNERSEIA